MRKPTVEIFILSFLAVAACKGTNDQSTLSEAATSSSGKYLALGDSITFGLNAFIEMNAENVAAGKFPSFSDSIGESRNFTVFNAACSGETSFSFIDGVSPDNGCRSGAHPFHRFLKQNYAVSQLSYAKDFLKNNADTKLVTISLGGNDLLMLRDGCAKESNPNTCILTKLPGVLVRYGNNLRTIVKELHSTGYKNDIVLLTPYGLNYKDNVQKIALLPIQAEIRAIAAMNGIKVAKVYQAMEVAAKAADGDTCKAGLMIPNPKKGLPCDEHPSALGRQVIVRAIQESLAVKASN